MSCKFLTQKNKPLPSEIGSGSALHQNTKFPDCKLKRLNQIDAVVGEARNCEETPYNGPCWWWKENKAGLADTEFK